jgi:hypothetical protein
MWRMWRMWRRLPNSVTKRPDVKSIGRGQMFRRNLFLERELSQDVERIESSHCEGGWELVLPLRNI